MNIRRPHQLARSTCAASSRRSPGWHYLDSAATAQKPQAVIDAITRAYARDYATVHRGVYQRSAEMTAALRSGARRGRRASSAAQRATRSSSPAARPRRSTSSRRAGAASEGRDRVLLSQLEHHSQHRPVAAAPATKIDVVPADRRRPDRPRRRRAMLTEQHRARRLRPCLERARLDPRREARRRPRARGRRASCCSTAARRCRACRSMSPRSAAISTSSPAHKLYGPTGIGACGARAETARSDAAMAGRRRDDRPRHLRATPPIAPPPARFEAGTPHIVGAIGLHAAID